MDEKVYRHTPKIFVGDIILLIVFIGFFTGAVHLLKYLSESLSLDDRHLKLKTGILSNHEVEIPFDKINTISVKQGLLGKILSYGDIIVHTGNDVSGIAFKSIDNPQQIKALIQGRIK